MRIGINPIGWSNDDLPALGGETPLETALSEGKEIGYEGFELGNKFPREPAALKAKLAEYGLACVSGWYSGRLAKCSVEEEIERVGPHLELLAYNGAKVMVYGEVQDSIQGAIDTPLHKRPQFRERGRVERLRRTPDRASAATCCGRACASPTTTTWAPTARRPDNVDTLMRVTRQRSRPAVRYRPHGIRGGGPTESSRCWRSTWHASCHVHCKDVRPQVLKLRAQQRLELPAVGV